MHLAFSSTRSGREQIWSMRADGLDLKQLTTEGANSNPAWGTVAAAEASITKAAFLGGG